MFFNATLSNPIDNNEGRSQNSNGASLPCTNRFGEPGRKVYIVVVSVYKKKVDGLASQACKDNAHGYGYMDMPLDYWQRIQMGLVTGLHEC